MFHDSSCWESNELVKNNWKRWSAVGGWHMPSNTHWNWSESVVVERCWQGTMNWVQESDTLMRGTSSVYIACHTPTIHLVIIGLLLSLSLFFPIDTPPLPLYGLLYPVIWRKNNLFSSWLWSRWSVLFAMSSWTECSSLRTERNFHQHLGHAPNAPYIYLYLKHAGIPEDQRAEHILQRCPSCV